MSQQQLILILPVLGTLLPGIVKQLHGNALVNGLLATFVVLLASIGYVALGGKLTGNPAVDVPLLTTTISALLAGPLKPLDQYLMENWFNVVKPKPQLSGPRLATGGAASNAYMSPPGASPIPPRASRTMSTPPDAGG